MNRDTTGLRGLDIAPDGTVATAECGPHHRTLRVTAPDGTSHLVIGESEDDAAGWSVASAGDVDGDGYDDLIVGAPAARGEAAEPMKTVTV